jgi:PhzF family phenazine biosynthesis protein
VEVDLCGHATLAAAQVLFTNHFRDRDELTFDTLSGTLAVRRAGERLSLDFPARVGARVEVSSALVEALGVRPVEAYQARDLMAVLDSEAAVRDLAPDLSRVAALEAFAVVVTAPGSDVDFVSRFFAPRAGIPEDPVTGSSHCTLAPYWAGRLGRRALTARQLSLRGGELACALQGDRVLITGRSVEYMRGEIEVPTF